MDQVEGVYVSEAADTISPKLQLIWNFGLVAGPLLRRAGCILRVSALPIILQNPLQRPPRTGLNLRLLFLARLFLLLYDAVWVVI